MILRQLFQAVSRILPHRVPAQKPPRMYAVRHLDYLRFKVADENVALKLADWHARDKVARDAVEGYLNKIFPPSRCATGTFYRIDDDGYLKDVAYNGYLPQGWHTQAEEDKDRAYHWVEPNCPKVMLIIARMPRVPSRRELAEIVGWPYWEPTGQVEARDMLYQSVNHTLRTTEDGGDVLLDVPLCANFNAHPEIKATVEGWRMPHYLMPLMLLSPRRGLQFRPQKIEIPAAF